MPDVLVGAGTVVNQEQAQAAYEAGAKFIVSPGVIEEVILWAQAHNVPILAGALTPTEMIKGLHLATDYELVYVGGNRLGAQRAVPLSESVRLGETVGLGAYMVAPRTPGNYRGFWMLRNATGNLFGIGNEADDSFWVDIQVIENVSNYHYDFALEFCKAIWRSATARLICPDVSTPANGSVQFLISPDFENHHENEPTNWVHPNEARDCWIEESYPAIDL